MHLPVEGGIINRGRTYIGIIHLGDCLPKNRAGIFTVIFFFNRSIIRKPARFRAPAGRQDQKIPKMTILGILFLAGGIFVVSSLSLNTARGITDSAEKRWVTIGLRWIFPALLLAAAFWISSSHPDAAERFLASPANAALVFAVYCLFAAATVKRSGGKTSPGNGSRRPRNQRAAKLILFPTALAAGAVVIQVIGNQNDAIFAGLLGVAAVFSLPLLKFGGDPLAFYAACLPYLAFGLSHVLSQVMVEGDSSIWHYPVFEFIARSFAAGNFLPPWLPQSGGIRTGLFHINLFFGLPQKAAGYFIYSLFPIPIPVLYKFQYLLGIIILSLGWWLALKKITGNRYAAYFGTLMVTLGGTGFTFHQEQAVSTAYLFPWFIWCLLKLKESPRWLLPAAAVAGLGLSTHYPHIQLISLLLAAGALAAAGRFRPVAALTSGGRLILPSLVLAFLAIAPAIYIARHSPELASELRGMDVAQRPADLREYLQLQTGASSASPGYLRQYLLPEWSKTGEERPVVDVQDRCAFFVGRAGLLLAGAGLILAFPKSLTAGLAAVIFSLLSLGINSPIPLPGYLFQLGVPFFDVFRQWVHFFPMINFSLSLLAALAIARLVAAAGERFRRAAGIAIAVLVFLQVADTAYYGHKYLSLFPVPAETHDLREEFSERGEHSISSVFQYRDRFHLVRACGERAIPESPFLAEKVLNLEPEDAFNPGNVCLALRRDAEVSAVTRIPREALPAGVSVFGEETSRIDLRIGFNGLRGDVALDRPGLLVTPMNIGLRPRGGVNGERKPVWPVNAALTGVLLDEGSHRLELRVGHDIYLVLFLLQWLLFGSLAVFFIKTNKPG